MNYKRFFWLFLFFLIFLIGCSSQSGVKIFLDNQENYIVVKKEQSLDLPKPQKEGYEFEGWYFDCNFQNRCDESDLRRLKENVTLYPKWTPIKYAINLYDPPNKPISVTAEYNSPVRLQSYCDLKGFKLIGYSPSQDGEILYKDGFLMPAREVDLYVQKTPIKVSFETLCGECFDPRDFNDLKQSKNLPAPSKDGHKFDGWFLDKDYSLEFDIDNYSPQDDFKLYAKWTPIYCQVDFVIDNKTESLICLKGGYIAPSQAPQKPGYKFLGWFLDGQEFDFSRPILQNITLTANWELIVYKITYNLNGGQALDGAPTHFTIISQDIDLPIPQKPGYKFLGWQDAQGNTWPNIPADTAQDIELCAVWAPRRLQDIALIDPPQKLDYFIGESLDIAGLKIQANFDNGEYEIIDHNNQDLIVAEIENIADRQQISVKYLDREAYFEIFVHEVCVLKIEAINTKTEYIEGQDLDFGSVAIKIFYNNGGFETIGLKPQYLQDYDMNRLGRQTIKINYMGWETFFEIEIKAKSLIKIEAVNYQIEYNYMEELNTCVELLLYYDNDTTENIYLENAQINGYDKAGIGSQILTIAYNYGGVVKSCYIDITVLTPPKTISQIFFVSYPKTEYYLGEELDLSGGVIQVKYLYDEIYCDEQIDLAECAVSGFDCGAENDNLELTVNYERITCRYFVRIVNIFEFEEAAEGYIIKGLKPDYAQTKIIIPATYKGKPIIKILSWAFCRPIPIGEVIIKPRTCNLTFEMYVFDYCFFDCFVYCDVKYINWENLYPYSYFITFYSDNPSSLEYLAVEHCFIVAY